jgi:hypothetical protein
MNPGQVFLFLLCFSFLLGMLFLFEVALFRVACSVCRLPQPGVFKTISLVLMLLTIPIVADSFLGALLYEAYEASGYPLWEAGVIEFILALPIHMVLCSVIHSWMMGIHIREGLSVWFVEKLIKMTILFAIAGVVALLVLALPKGG